MNYIYSMIVWYMSFMGCEVSSLTRSTLEVRFIPGIRDFQNHLASLSVTRVHTSPSLPALAVRPAR